jgi:peroxiredoxin
VRVGEIAPPFTLRNQHGEAVALSDFAGARNVVLVFYPFAFSRVCTGELEKLRDGHDGLVHADAELLAISCDHMFSLRAFADRDGYAFSLLSDFWPHGAVSAAYEAFDEANGAARRTTVVVDRDGVVRWRVDNAMSDARSVDDYRDVLYRLS